MPKAATAPAATLPAPAVTMADVLAVVPEPVVDADVVAVVSVVAPLGPPVAAGPEAEGVMEGEEEEEVAPVPVAEEEEDEEVPVGLLSVVEADAEALDEKEEVEDSELELLLDVVEPEAALIWKGNEYWKVEASESKLILMPYVAKPGTSLSMVQAKEPRLLSMPARNAFR